MLVRAGKVTAKYGVATALADVSCELRKGEILAVLGPNGSGKTTLFRLLLGLMAPSAGTLDVVPLARIGATIEIPSLYGHLTALENLEITSHLKESDESAADRAALLDEVGLGDAKATPVQTFSLGMKQRLALAEALLGNPELLILDEPTNGLDPEGIRWFREWLVDAVARRGVGVILSSHILSEVASVAHRLLVLRKGTARFSGTAAELAGPAKGRVRVKTRDVPAALRDLRAAGFEAQSKDGEIHVATSADRAPDIARLLVTGGHDVLDLGATQATLEDLYLSLVQEAA